MPLIPGFRQADLREFEANLFYRVGSRIAKTHIEKHCQKKERNH